ncbi:MAG TPA: hypothetical protein VMW27_01530, partial [Thermoanaerobaculia bacterium]|nr:hypothetical protein [Thermoanaerobaculia bacterium]
VEEARMRVLESAFQEIPLARASQAVADGRVLDAKTGQVFQWQPAPMVLAISERLRERVESEEYERQVTEAVPRFAFALR